MPLAGFDPARTYVQQILSLSCIPISPQRRKENVITITNLFQYKFYFPKYANNLSAGRVFKTSAFLAQPRRAVPIPNAKNFR